MTKPRKEVYCECPGCEHRHCRSVNGTRCGRTHKWLGLTRMKHVGWRRKRSMWFCPVCAGEMSKHFHPCARDRRKNGEFMQWGNSRIERADSPTWHARGQLLLTFLRGQPRNWQEMCDWACTHEFDAQMLRNIMASVDSQVLYTDGKWRTVASVGGFKPVPVAPGTTLGARIAYESM